MHFSRHERIALMMMLVPMHKVVPNLIKPRPYRKRTIGQLGTKLQPQLPRQPSPRNRPKKIGQPLTTIKLSLNRRRPLTRRLNNKKYQCNQLKACVKFTYCIILTHKIAMS